LVRKRIAGRLLLKAHAFRNDGLKKPWPDGPVLVRRRPDDLSRKRSMLQQQEERQGVGVEQRPAEGSRYD